MKPRDNPFASHHLEALRFRPVGTSWEELLARLDTLGGRAVIVGSHGSGKTTLLEALAGRLAQRGLQARVVRLEGYGPAFLGAGPFAPCDAVLLDGADRVGSIAWARLRWRCRRAAVLLVTSHHGGRLPTLHHCVTSPQLLADLIADRVGGRSCQHLRLAEDLHRRHGGDLRAALRELYDHVRETPGGVGVSSVAFAPAGGPRGAAPPRKAAAQWPRGPRER